MLTVAIQYPSFGPQHPARLEAIVKAAPYPDVRVVAMEMFCKDSDYQWRPVTTSATSYVRHTVMDCESAVGRRKGLALRRAVCRALDEIRPDVLVVNGLGHRESQMSLRWCRRNGCRMVMLMDGVRENRRRTWWKEAYKRLLLRGIRAGFAAGTPHARYLAHLGVPKEGIFHPGSCVVDNAYWAEQARRVRQEAEAVRVRLGLTRRYFLCIARFIPLKNIPFLIRAYAQYRALAGPDAFGLVVCGSGPEEARILSTIRDTGVEGVHLAGWRQVDELPSFYALAGCFILASSEFECWGLVVNEAMASGLPVLLSRMVGSAEDLVQEGRNGYTFDPSDGEDLAQSMLKISQDEATRLAMGRESQRIIEGHSLEVGAASLWRSVAAALSAPR